MKIETKFSVGDKLYFLRVSDDEKDDNTYIFEGVVEDIAFPSVSNGKPIPTYKVKVNDKLLFDIEEDECFSTEQDAEGYNTVMQLFERKAENKNTNKTGEKP